MSLFLVGLNWLHPRGIQTTNNRVVLTSLSVGKGFQGNLGVVVV